MLGQCGYNCLELGEVKVRQEKCLLRGFVIWDKGVTEGTVLLGFSSIPHSGAVFLCPRHLHGQHFGALRLQPHLLLLNWKFPEGRGPCLICLGIPRTQQSPAELASNQYLADEQVNKVIPVVNGGCSHYSV